MSSDYSGQSFHGELCSFEMPPQDAPLSHLWIFSSVAQSHGSIEQTRFFASVTTHETVACMYALGTYRCCIAMGNPSFGKHPKTRLAITTKWSIGDGAVSSKSAYLMRPMGDGTSPLMMSAATSTTAAVLEVPSLAAG